jgi:hypothetical protein
MAGTESMIQKRPPERRRGLCEDDEAFRIYTKDNIQTTCYLKARKLSRPKTQ